MMTYRVQGAAFLMTLVFIFGLPTGLIVPPPERAHATWPTLPTDSISNILNQVYGALKYALQKVQEYYDYLIWVKEWILEPIAFIQSGKALKGITGGMLSFVAGESNGTGRPQFVQNLPWHLRSVGDNTTSAFLRQLRANSDSPYAGVIADSLRSNYAEQTSLAGFFRSNRNTLPQFSQNPTAFLSGNWSQGGMRAWFALTTQSQNNPYVMHRRAEQKLGILLNQAETAVNKQLDWGDGLLSWCDDSEGPSEGGVCDAGGYTGTYTDGVCIQDEASDTPDIAQVPGAPCTKKDGTQGKIATPGSTVNDFFQETLKLDSKKLVEMGNAASQITEMIGGIMETVSLVQGIIGGPQGGLAGVAKPGADGKSILDGYATSSPYFGASNCTINENLGQQDISSGQETLDRITQYVAYWEVIGPAAVEASTTLHALVATCSQNLASISNATDRKVGPGVFISRKEAAQRVVSQATAALAPNGVIGQTLSTYYNLDATMASSTQFVEDLQANLAAPPPVGGDCELYADDVNALRDLPPSANDLVQAEKDSISSGITTMTEPWLVYYKEPEDLNDVEGLSFNLANGSLVDKFNLLIETAEDPEIVELCTP